MDEHGTYRKYSEAVRRLEKAGELAAKINSRGSMNAYWDAVMMAGIERDYLRRCGVSEVELDHIAKTSRLDYWI